MKEDLFKGIENIKEELINMNKYIYENPELGHEEFKAMAILCDFLEKNGFNITKGAYGLKTAFIGEYKSQKDGPTICYLCEYDALPSIGHGCGHNMIGTMSAGASVLLSKEIENIGGRILVYGTPAEESNGAKVDFALNGAFSDVDVAMLLHPKSGNSEESGHSLAIDALEFEFFGKTSHAASAPEEGINALDSCIQLFNGINALRQHVKSDVRIHGVIKNGGVAANIVPDYAVARFYIRASTRKYLNEVVYKVKNTAKAAADMTGATYKINNYEYSFDELMTNDALSKAFNENLIKTGIDKIEKPSKSAGSTDLGNVSLKVPSIHPNIGLGKDEINGHSREMADLTITQIGEERLIQGTLALALTGYDVICDEKLLKNIKDEFRLNKEK